MSKQCMEKVGYIYKQVVQGRTLARPMEEGDNCNSSVCVCVAYSSLGNGFLGAKNLEKIYFCVP
jgi:hypothetical protein